ncbi:hypothetical protein JDV02_000038 [Purpureocillium takamizusanense]|uniref:Uncharacterized protein n=1 Tax=Purpureocillium takamizusanense TaxID=2060973 RepID=A0A9Q8V6F7_9HYPO|nr:uncharacterized protein JDV02_000038 [Purpureocillium takamizusanense]UNI13281.1 hypothetical protein JDV02_000038 [Purpureocillium takamizusanense]
MKLMTLSVLSAYVASTLAADCFGIVNKGLADLADPYWDARYAMCHNEPNSGCGYQQECSTYASKPLGYGGQMKLQVTLTRKYTSNKKGFKDCWAATEDMINQCVKGQQRYAGTWSANGQLYQVDGEIVEA